MHLQHEEAWSAWLAGCHWLLNQSTVTKPLGCSTAESAAQASCSRTISDEEHIILSMHDFCADIRDAEMLMLQPAYPFAINIWGCLLIASAQASRSQIASCL